MNGFFQATASRTLACAMLCLAAAPAPRARAGNPGDTPAAISIQTQGPRTGGPASISLQNEINAAIDRGRAWLMACQNPDGSWGTNPCVRLTSLATLALAHDPSPDEKAAVGKAGQWLLHPTVTNAGAAFDQESQAWREIALRAAVPADPRRTAAFATRMLTRSATNGFTHTACMLIREAIAPQPFLFPAPPADTNAPAATRIFCDCTRFMPSAASPVQPGATNVLLQLAASWSGHGIPADPGSASGRRYWTFAHFINRAGGGTLADAAGNLVDWRNDLARALVETQQIDTNKQGNGFWRADNAPADWARHPVAETAFSLLALDEL